MTFMEKRVSWHIGENLRKYPGLDEFQVLVYIDISGHVEQTINLKKTAKNMVVKYYLIH